MDHLYNKNDLIEAIEEKFGTPHLKDKKTYDRHDTFYNKEVLEYNVSYRDHFYTITIALANEKDEKRGNVSKKICWPINNSL